MCDREALEPAEKVLGTKITKQKTTKFECPPHLYPSDRKGIWLIAKNRKRRRPNHPTPKTFLTKEFLQKWERTKSRCRQRRAQEALTQWRKFHL